MPDYDIVATNADFRSTLVQVKAISGTSWQFDIRKFVEVTLDGRKQVIGRPKQLARDIICVMVALRDYGEDRFYVLKWSDLTKIAINNHREFLDRHGGIRPKRFDSFHTAVKLEHVEAYRDQWELIEASMS